MTVQRRHSLGGYPEQPGAVQGRRPRDRCCQMPYCSGCRRRSMPPGQDRASGLIRPLSPKRAARPISGPLRSRQSPGSEKAPATRCDPPPAGGWRFRRPGAASRRRAGRRPGVLCRSSSGRLSRRRRPRRHRPPRCRRSTRRRQRIRSRQLRPGRRSSSGSRSRAAPSRFRRRHGLAHAQPAAAGRGSLAWPRWL